MRSHLCSLARHRGIVWAPYYAFRSRVGAAAPRAAGAPVQMRASIAAPFRPEHPPEYTSQLDVVKALARTGGDVQRLLDSSRRALVNP